MKFTIYQIHYQVHVDIDVHYVLLYVYPYINLLAHSITMTPITRVI